MDFCGSFGDVGYDLSNRLYRGWSEGGLMNHPLHDTSVNFCKFRLLLLC